VEARETVAPWGASKYDGYRTLKENKEIINIAKKIQGLSGKAVIEYGREVERIVKTNCRDKREIERSLDGMLDFCFSPKIRTLYRKLRRFYCGIDESAAIRYVHYYRDMWDPKEKKLWQKKH